MSIYFGTDGIRGIVHKDLSFDVCYKTGNAISRIKPKAKILLGRDTRTSGDFVAMAFSVGAVIGGADVIDVGVVPTAGISYLTVKNKADFGVVVSASHNPAEHNGIKIFDSNGNKINITTENLIERQFIHNHIANVNDVGTYCQDDRMYCQYLDYLIEGLNLKGFKVVVDASNGAGYKIAPLAFRKAGAKVIKMSCENDGKNINKNCGALYPENLVKKIF